MLASLLFATALPPLAVQDQLDLNCVAVVMITASSGQYASDPKIQEGLSANLMYYVGKLEGRDPNFQLQERLFPLLLDPKFMAEIVPDERKRCGSEMIARGRALSEMGRAMQAAEASPPSSDSGT
jgi:hypothetical protein